jgi:hypothetical protein
VIWLPAFAVLASLPVSLVQISAIREEIRGIRGDIKLLAGEVRELVARKP